jgi:predicted DCC family thiol-disulfide oxidoreductase YuxK
MSPSITILIDGQCPLCRREASFLERLDRGRHRLGIADITDPAFEAGRYGLSDAAVMDSIHGILPDGRVIRGMEVFRRAYRAVGFGWLLAPTGWPVLRPLFDRLYAWFARNRLRLTGRNIACADGRCEQRAG